MFRICTEDGKARPYMAPSGTWHSDKDTDRGLGNKGHLAVAPASWEKPQEEQLKGFLISFMERKMFQKFSFRNKNIKNNSFWSW